VAGLSLTTVIGEEAVQCGLTTGPRARMGFLGCRSPEDVANTDGSGLPSFPWRCAP